MEQNPKGSHPQNTEHQSKTITNTTTRCTTTATSNRIQEDDGLKLHKINQWMKSPVNRNNMGDLSRKILKKIFEGVRTHWVTYYYMHTCNLSTQVVDH